MPARKKGQGRDRLSLADPAVALATWFGAGLLPKAPGTWGSLAALPVAWALHAAFGRLGLAAAAAAAFALGLASARAVLARTGKPDDPRIVIDEVAGQWLTLAPVQPDLVLYALGFALFRIADIVKPWPVSWADQRVGGTLGVMLDDVIAAVYAGIILFAFSLWSQTW